MIITLSTACANAMLTALNTELGANATIKLYTGSKPATPETAITNQILLGTLTCGATAGAVADKALTFGAVTQDTAADNTGTATWARIAKSDGTPKIDVDVTNTVGTGFIKMNTTAVVSGGPILINSCVITL